VIVGPGVFLSADDAAALARLLGHGVRRARAGGEVVGREVLALVDELTTVGRAHRATSAVGSTEVPLIDQDDDHADTVTVQEAAARIGVTDRRVRQLINAGRLSGVKHGGSWYVPLVEVDRIGRTRAAA